jgi:ubiquinone/menaquinone biosynthesis C-methylase UbiE
VRDRLRALLSRLHVLPTLTLRAHTKDGDVFLIEESVDRLEALRNASRDANVFYLLGTPEVMPLTDASVDEIAAETEPTPEAAREFFRVLRSGGTVAVAGSSGVALNVVERVLNEAGFVDLAVPSGNGVTSLAARKP